jgi:hypothetical protein
MRADKKRFQEVEEGIAFRSLDAVRLRLAVLFADLGETSIRGAELNFRAPLDRLTIQKGVRRLVPALRAGFFICSRARSTDDTGLHPVRNRTESAHHRDRAFEETPAPHLHRLLSPRPRPPRFSVWII